MNAILAIMGALGGVAVFVGAVWALLRGIIHQRDAVVANTDATTKLTNALEKVNDRLDRHETRIAVLEDWRKGRPI